MNIATLVYTYYNNPNMLAWQIANWRAYTVPFKLIIVDDGSQRFPLASVWQDCGLDARLFCVDKDIPWNQDGARNLAMKHCETEWALLTDMDHVLSPTDAVTIATMSMDTGHYYTPRRVDMEGAEVKRHPNSFLIECDTFWKTGGYDEDFCGWYSGDILFKRNRDSVATEVKTDAFDLIVCHESRIFDANTKLGRKGSEFDIKKHPKFKEVNDGGAYVAKDPIRFPWHQLQ